MKAQKWWWVLWFLGQKKQFTRVIKDQPVRSISIISMFWGTLM
jgi:hypothetical protein